MNIEKSYAVASFTATPEYGLNPLLVRFRDNSYGNAYGNGSVLINTDSDIICNGVGSEFLINEV
jgi:PKD repeat protein